MNRSMYRCGVLAMLACVSCAQASYTLSLESDVTSVVPGTSFTLDVNLKPSDSSADFVVSSILTLEFNQPGLLYTGYSWGTPFVTGGIDDLSKPKQSGLPTSITASSYGDSSKVDLYFENLVPLDQSFIEGSLLKVHLTVPTTYQGGDLLITANPDTMTGPYTLDENGDPLPMDYTLGNGNVNASSVSLSVPEPGTIALALGVIGASLAPRKRAPLVGTSRR